MSPFRRFPTHSLLGGIFCVAAVLAVLTSCAAVAQEAKPAKPRAKGAAKPAAAPFGEEPAKPEAKPKPAPSPFGEKAAKKEARVVAPKIDVTKEPLRTSPAIEAVLENKPTTPPQLAQAASTLSMLGRPDLAKQFLAQLLAAKPDDAQMAALLEHFSSGFFLEMAARAELLPEARQVVDAVMAGANRFKSDAKRIAGLIRQLQDSSADKRYRAMIALLDTGVAAVEPLVAVLADGKRSAEHANVRTVLARFKAESLPVVLAALGAPDPNLVVQAIELLVEMNAREAAIHLFPATGAKNPAVVRQAAQSALTKLLGRVPSRREGVEVLMERAQEYLDDRQPPGRVIDGQVELWQWDSAKGRPAAKSYLADDAAHAMALRLARQAHALAPEDRLVQRLLVVSLLEAASYEAGLDKPLADGPGTAAAEAAAFDMELLEEALSWAMSNDHPAAATATAGILGRKGTAETLVYSPERATPLVLAARHGDRRLRMTALEAIVRLQPQQPYPGSSYVPESLAYFAATTGQRRVLVAGTTAEKALQTIGGLSASGYVIDAVANGREAVRRAVSSPDYDFILVDILVDNPPADVVLQYLRRDGRTARVPIGVLAHDGLWQRADQLSRRTSMSAAFYRPHDQKALEWQVRQLGLLAGRDFTPFDVRQAQAERALELLAALGAGGARFYDLSRIQPVALGALSVPALAMKAVPVVALLDSPESQRALLEVASRPGPIKLRQAAAAAFDASTRRLGILLLTAEILRQYDRYNESEKLDRESQVVLGSILDSIEAPSKKLSAVKGKADLVPAPAPQVPPAAVPSESPRKAPAAEK